jgi:hypothetical protein
MTGGFVAFGPEGALDNARMPGPPSPHRHDVPPWI